MAQSNIRFRHDDAPCGAETVDALAAVQKDLAESRRQFDSLLQSLSGLFYRCELTSPWRISFISDGVEALTGYRAEEIEAGWADVIYVEDSEAVSLAVADALDANRSFAITYRIRHKSGEMRWVSERGHAVRDGAGQPLFLEGVISDISDRKQAEELQRMLATRSRKTLDVIPQMVWSMAADGTEEYYNSQWAEFTGRKIGKVYNLTRLELVHPEDRDQAFAIWERSLATASPYEAQYRIKHHSGDYRWVLSRGRAEIDAAGQVVRWYGTCTDIHEWVCAQKAVIANQAFIDRLIGASPDSLLLLDGYGNILFANSIAEHSLSPGDARSPVGLSWTDLVPRQVRRDAYDAFTSARRDGRPAQFTARLDETADIWWDVIVTPVSDDEHGEARLLVTSRDISHQKLAEQRANWSASHDSLTQLPNRLVLQQRLDALISSNSASGGNFALMLLDVDEFKRTNDTLGHDTGDALLCAFADRLQQVVREEDLVARLGGDEFAILLSRINSEADLAGFAETMFAALQEPFTHDEKLLECRASVGASLYPIHGTEKSDLLKNADLALYAAKASGRGTFKIFEPGMRAEMQKRHSMIALAQAAIADDLIIPYFQPKIEMATGAVAGFEALLRWRHSSRGPQTPETISAAFDDLTLAAQISDRMIGQIIAIARQWLQQGVDFKHIAINASAAEFRRGDFAEHLLEQLAKAGIPAHCIQLEVTETVFLGRGAGNVEHALKMLSASGISIALDDFGTGFASLSHLKQFPVNILKIDRSFIRNLQLDPDDDAIVDAVIGLGKSLKIDVVAEGIETAAQHDTLAALGCKYGQGYLYGKAMAAPQAMALLGRPWEPARVKAA